MSWCCQGPWSGLSSSIVSLFDLKRLTNLERVKPICIYLFFDSSFFTFCKCTLTEHMVFEQKLMKPAPFIGDLSREWPCTKQSEKASVSIILLLLSRADGGPQCFGFMKPLGQSVIEKRNHCTSDVSFVSQIGVCLTVELSRDLEKNRQPAGAALRDRTGEHG